MTVYLIGVGMGNPDTMTIEASEAIKKSGAIIGAARLIEGYADKACFPLIAAEAIAEKVKSCGFETVSVLLSGDIGFYSGAKKLYPLLDFAELVAIPGISSLGYFCAKLHTTWQDVFLVSAHGREHNVVGEIQRHSRVFALTGSGYTAADLIAELCDRGLSDVRVSVGERLSYSDERIVSGTAKALLGEEFLPLSVVLVDNEAPIIREFSAPSLRDEDFARAKVPMTKEEVRAISISKLRLSPEHRVWDVGAGTGSVTVEIAFSVPAGQVFAIERKAEAVELIKENRARFSLSNIEVVEGLAPEALLDLPAPDRVFLGGTAGNMEEILKIAIEKNPSVRVVVTAVTLETIAEATRCFASLGISDTDMVQISATRTRTAGAYHLMDSQNPVWVISGEVHCGKMR